MVPGINDTVFITMNVGGPVVGTVSVNNKMLLGTEQITFAGTLDTAGMVAYNGLMVSDRAASVFVPGATVNDGNVLVVGNEWSAPGWPKTAAPRTASSTRWTAIWAAGRWDRDRHHRRRYLEE